MVIGGGISGIQASLDLAALGFKVYLVEKEAILGGKMAKLDKTFPTNDCSMCILSPKLIECAREPNITILSYSEVKTVSGSAGNFQVILKRKPRYVDESLCNGCGACTAYCPVKIPDSFNQNLSSASAINILCPQAIPLCAAIDKEHCLFLTQKKCKICSPVCLHGAIDFTQSEEELHINVGAILVTAGCGIFEAKIAGQYGYSRYKNVITQWS